MEIKTLLHKYKLLLLIGLLLNFQACGLLKKDADTPTSESSNHEDTDENPLKEKPYIDDEELVYEKIIVGGTDDGSSDDENDHEEASEPPVIVSNETVSSIPPTTSNSLNKNSTPMPAPATAVPVERNRLEDFKVGIKSADSMLVDQSYFVEVFIGKDSTQLRVSNDETSAWSSIPASLGQFASVELKASGSKVEIKSEKKQCVKIDQSGSHLDFNIKPLEEGKIKLKAEINLYEEENCSDTPVPKVTETLEIEVQVDRLKEEKAIKKEFENIFWEKLKEFWGALLAILFGLILFLLRKKLKKWFGFEEAES